MSTNEDRLAHSPALCRPISPRDTANDLCKHRNPPVQAQLPTIYDHGGFCELLKQMHPLDTAYHVEAICGVPAGTVEGWFVRNYRPSILNYAKMLGSYGPVLLHASITTPPDWLVNAKNRQRRTELETEASRLEREIKRLA